MFNTIPAATAMVIMVVLVVIMVAGTDMIMLDII